MKNLKYLLTSLLSAGLSQYALAQEINPGQLQEKVQSCVDKVYNACVYLADYDTVAKRVNGQRFSGVVVSKDGLVLTAAHVGKPGKVYQVIFPDGKSHIAIGLGRIQRFDAAVLKINKPGEWAYAEMGWSSSLKLNEPCVSIAYPGSFTPMRAVIRFGYVADVMDSRRKMIRTTCLMEPGDSGGPVFDLFGRVIGLHSSISKGLDSNFEIPIDVFRKYWSAFMKAEDYRELPVEEPVTADSLAEKKVYFDKINSIELMLADKESKLDDFTLEIFGPSDTVKAIGTLIKIDGLSKGNQRSSYVVTKGSLLSGSVFALLRDGKRKKLEIVYQDDRKDLALLEIESRFKNGIDLTNINQDTLTEALLGQILISAHPGNEGEISVQSARQFNLPGTYSAGYLGSALEVKKGRNVISMVQEKSPASVGGLRLADEIVSINNVRITTPEQFVKEIQKNKPKDTIDVALNRDGTDQRLRVVLARRPAVTIDHVAERFEDGKSDRRDGFNNVFIHDSKLKPAECGGPLFDLEGSFMGINIARYSRTSSLAVTAREVQEFVKAALVHYRANKLGR